MSDPSTTATPPPRTPDQFVPRKATIKDGAVGGYGLSLGIATAHWIGKCIQAHHMVPMEDALLELWLPTLLPVGQFVITVVKAKAAQWAKKEGIDLQPE